MFPLSAIFKTPYAKAPYRVSKPLEHSAPKHYRHVVAKIFTGVRSSFPISSSFSYRLQVKPNALQTKIKSQLFSMSTKPTSKILQKDETNFRFPAKDDILRFMEKHPLTQFPYFKEKDFALQIATHFEKSKKSIAQIEMDVLSLMHDFNEKYCYSESLIDVIFIDLTTVLKECARKTKV